ncbi:MAG: OmpA family protein, partial [Bacteroidales bacterium]|nr:OmpA family protein [Bacteroidales bacterium]
EKVEEPQPEQQVVETQPVEQVEEPQPKPQVEEKVEEQVVEQPKQPEPQPVEKVEEQVVKTDTAMVVPNISFGRGFTESNLDKQAKEALDSIANLMKSNPNLKLELIGHTDSTGTEEVNIRVGKQRAENIKQMLVKRGVKSSRIKCFTKGETEPLVPNNSEENMAKNRRVEMIFKD